jgi:predicted transcriptional regulator
VTGHGVTRLLGVTQRRGLDAAPAGGDTFGMKTAVSIPDDVFQDAERLASRLRTSRSQLYARALAEFVARHDDDHVTALMDRAVREAGGEADAFVQAAAQQSLERAEW